MLAPQIVREAPLADVLVIARRPDDRTVYAHLGRDSRRLRFHKAGDASDFEKAVREDTDPTTSSTGAVSIERDRSPAFDSLSTKADPETFVKALMEGHGRDVLTKRDHDRVLATFETAIESDADGFLVGFAIRGAPTRVVWANVEVIRAGILSPGELQPDPGPGTAAFDMRLAGLVFVEDPLAEPSDLRPSLLADRPWVLMPYPGPVSWSSLLRTAAYLLP